MNTSMNRWTYIFPAASVAIIAAAIAIVVVDNLQYSRGEEHIVPSGFLVTSSFALLALSLAAIAAGFLVMQRAPDPGAALAIGGAIGGGLLFFWLILPPLVGIAIAVYAFFRAREISLNLRN